MKNGQFFRTIFPVLLLAVLAEGLAAAPAQIYRSTLRLKYWNYESGLSQVGPTDPLYPYHRLNPFPTSGTERDWEVIELENDFVKVTVVPQHGGRVLRFINKITGSNQYYLNPEGFKTSHGGRLGWVTVPGGIEWMIGSDEHAPTFYVPFEHYTGPDATEDGLRIEDYDGGVRLTMVFDEHAWSAGLGTPIVRWRTEIRFEVPDNEAVYRTHITVHNDSGQTKDLMFWENLLVCPGPGNMIITPGSQANLNQLLVLPDNVYHLLDHNGMEPWLTGSQTPWKTFNWHRHSNTTNTVPQKWLSFPSVIQAANLNLAHLQQWYDEGLNACGLFIPRGRGATHCGVYNLDTDEGFAKLFPETVQTSIGPIETGTKYWTFGVYGGGAAYNYSDGTNTYLELMGGPCRVFEEMGVYPHPSGELDRIPVPSGGSLAWSNTYISPYGIGGFRYASERAVLNLEAASAVRIGDLLELDLGAYTLTPENPCGIALEIGGVTVHQETGLSIGPGTSPGPYRFTGEVAIPGTVPAGAVTAVLTLFLPDGTKVSTSCPITIREGQLHMESFAAMPAWSDFLNAKTPAPAQWTIETNGEGGFCLNAQAPGPGIDNRILIFPLTPGARGGLAVRMRCPSGTGLNYWARVAIRTAAHRDEICGAGVNDPGAGWEDLVFFSRHGMDGTWNTWQTYRTIVEAGPEDRYLAIGLELGSLMGARPKVGWDSIEIGGQVISSFLAIE